MRLRAGALSALLATLPGVPLAAQEPAPTPTPEATEVAPAAPAGGETPAAAVPAASAEPAAAGVGPPAPARQLSLREAVRLALEGNFGLLGQADALASARLAESVSAAAFHPQITPRISGFADDQTFALDALQRLPWTGGLLSGSASYRRNDRQDAVVPDTTDLRVTLSQPLLRGFGETVSRADQVNARRGRESQERSFALYRQGLAVEVTRVFYQVVRQRQLLEVARQSRERGRALQAASEARLAVGLASRLDVLRAELQGAQADSAALAAETALASALESFRLMLGLDAAASVEPEDVALPETLNADEPPLAELLRQAFANRLDVLEAQDRVADAERNLALARQRLKPQVDLNVGVSRTGYGASFDDAFNNVDERVDVFVTAAYPLERAAERVARANAELELSARQRALRQKQIDVEGEVRAAVRELDRIRRSVLLQRRTVEFAEQQRRLAELRFQRGLASSLDVVDAESSLFSARSALVALLSDHEVARMQLRRVVGVLSPGLLEAP